MTKKQMTVSQIAKEFEINSTHLSRVLEKKFNKNYSPIVKISGDILERILTGRKNIIEATIQYGLDETKQMMFPLIGYRYNMDTGLYELIEMSIDSTKVAELVEDGTLEYKVVGEYKGITRARLWFRKLVPKFKLTKHIKDKS